MIRGQRHLIRFRLVPCAIRGRDYSQLRDQRRTHENNLATTLEHYP